MPPFYAKIWDITKQYWWVILVSIASVAFGFFVAKTIYDKGAQFDATLKLERDKYEDLIKKFKQASEEEADRHEENLKKLQDDLDEANAKYLDAKERLEVNKAKVYNQVLQKYNGDPAALSSKFSEVTGIRVYGEKQ